MYNGRTHQQGASFTRLAVSFGKIAVLLSGHGARAARLTSLPCGREPEILLAVTSRAGDRSQTLLVCIIPAIARPRLSLPAKRIIARGRWAGTENQKRRKRRRGHNNLLSIHRWQSPERNGPALKRSSGFPDPSRNEYVTMRVGRALP
jgi:hypothetical protein